MQLSKEEYAKKKRICNGRSVGIENSVTRDKYSASLGKPCDAKQALVTEFSIRTSSLKILIFFDLNIKTVLVTGLWKTEILWVAIFNIPLSFNDEWPFDKNCAMLFHKLNTISNNSVMGKEIFLSNTWCNDLWHTQFLNDGHALFE